MARTHGAAALYRKYCGLAWALLTLVLISLVLFAGPDVGLSNNGDFVRTMNASSLSFGERTPSHTYADTFHISLPHGSAPENVASILFGTGGLRNYPSLHVVPVRLSVVVSLVVNKLTGLPMDTYHLQVLGVMYTLAYAAGIGLLLSQFRLRRLWLDAAVKAAAILVLCDIGYVAYFNSLYGEALEHVALVYCAALLLRVLTRVPTGWDAAWCALASGVYGWSKFFNIPLAILLILVMEGAVLLRSGKRRALAFGGAALALLLGVWAAVPSWMDIETNYNAVFYGVVRDVDEATAKEYLADLGLPEELSDFRDTNYYLPGLTDELEARGLREQAESVTKPDLILFYLTHPGRLLEQAGLTALHCGMVRPYYLANHGEGFPLMSFSQRMSLWGGLRDALALDTVWGNLAVPLAFTALVLLCFRRRARPLWLALPLLALWGALAYCYLLPVMLNGEGDFAKHMFPFIELMDLLLLSCLALSLDKAAPSPEKRPAPAEAREGRPPRFSRLAGATSPAVGCALALVLALPLIAGGAQGLWREGSAHPGLESGAYVTLGSYEGEALTWQVVGQEGDRYTLLCQAENISLPFDQAGDNDWRTSSLREWLNGAFLDGFSREERSLLQDREHTLILSDRYREQAERGDLDFACSHIAVLSDRLWQRAYQVQVSDLVCLPDVTLIASLARAGWDMSGAAYWLDTPYCPSANLTRYVGQDGHVYFGDASAPLSVRPVVEVAGARVTGGSGSLADPFTLD